MLNLHRQFLDLFPENPLLVGDVLSISNGMATVQLPGGGLLIARGEASVGARVFVLGGAIEGPAPTLTYIEGEV